MRSGRLGGIRINRETNSQSKGNLLLWLPEGLASDVLTAGLGGNHELPFYSPDDALGLFNPLWSCACAPVRPFHRTATSREDLFPAAARTNLDSIVRLLFDETRSP